MRGLPQRRPPALPLRSGMLPLARHEWSNKEVCEGTNKGCERLRGVSERKWCEKGEANAAVSCCLEMAL